MAMTAAASAWKSACPRSARGSRVGSSRLRARGLISRAAPPQAMARPVRMAAVFVREMALIVYRVLIFSFL
jgi:hypothetical protein